MIRRLISGGVPAVSLRRAPESIFFFTFHKCASALFGDFVLKRFEGLEHVDHATAIYNQGGAGKPAAFRERGCIYGPIRLSVNRRSPVYEKVVAPATAKPFIRSRNALMLVRDPRDILVSCYYSFGFSHGPSANPEIRAQQEALRERIREGEPLDEFALRSARAIARHFERLESVRQACARSLVLRYEDMIHDFGAFIRRLEGFARLQPGVAEELYARSRPKAQEKLAEHNRSGRTGGFREKLRPGTVAALNVTFADALGRFGYAA